MEFLKGVNGLYYLVILVMAGLAAEALIPWRRGVNIDIARWIRNAALAFYGMILLGLAPAIAGYGGAVAAQDHHIGLMNLIALPLWVKLVVTVLAIDLLSYGEHRVLHKWYAFWRMHRAHHTDAHIDATTGLRFHPFETIFRALAELGVVLLFGIPPEGILLVFGVHVFANIFTHTNIALPLSVDRVVARLITTPHVHRLHHSADPAHQFSNFGTAFTIWDQMFGTYLGPEHLRMDETFGVEGPEAMARDSFANLALDPFRKPKAAAIPRPAPVEAALKERPADAGS